MKLLSNFRLVKDINCFYKKFYEVLQSYDGFYIGKNYTIHQAELLDKTYYINFGDEVHEYIFEEVEQ